MPFDETPSNITTPRRLSAAATGLCRSRPRGSEPAARGMPGQDELFRQRATEARHCGTDVQRCPVAEEHGGGGLLQRHAVERAVGAAAEQWRNDAMLGATTTLLVCRANWVANAEYQDLSPMKPCCSQMTPVA